LEFNQLTHGEWRLNIVDISVVKKLKSWWTTKTKRHISNPFAHWLFAAIQCFFYKYVGLVGRLTRTAQQR